MKTTEQPVTVEMGAGYMSVTLRIDPEADGAACDPGLCKLQLTEANVRLTSEIARRVEAYVEQWRAGEHRDQPLVIEAAPPVNGKNGRIEWQPACDPAQLNQKVKSADGKVDFYSMHRFIDVSQGQHVATIIAPTEGEVGYDLRGEVIAPKPGQPDATRFDPKSFDVDEEGRCLAKIAGVLRVVSRDVSINPVLHVPDNVDFSSGNIEFIGDVVIGGGVCDCFSVKAAGNVEVKGTIEAATVRVGGSLHAKNGIATRGQGRVQVGHDLRAKYLNSVTAIVGHDVQVEKEIIGSNLVVGRTLEVPKGSLIGGKTIVCGPAHLQTLGSDGELATTLVLAHSPKIHAMIDTVRQRLRAIEKEKAQAIRRVEEIRGMTDASHESREELTTLMFKPYELDSTARNLTERLEQLKAMYAKLRTVDLTVDRMIYAGVRLVVDGQHIVFRQSIKGPSVIRWDRRHKLVYVADNGSEWPMPELPGVELHEA